MRIISGTNRGTKLFTLEGLNTRPTLDRVKEALFSKINYDLNKLQNDITLKGIFAKEMLKKLNQENISEEEKEIIEKAVEIGFEALE